MQDLINKHLANGFSGFKGIRIEEYCRNEGNSKRVNF